MTPREKRTVVIGAVAVIAFGGYQLVVRRAIERQRTLERIVAEESEALRKIRDRAGRYQTMAASMERIRGGLNGADDGSRLMTAVHAAAQQLKINGNIVDLKPAAAPLAGGRYTEMTLDLRLEGVTLGELTELIRLSYGGGDIGPVGLKSLSIKRAAKDAGKLAASIQFVAVARSSPGG